MGNVPLEDGAPHADRRGQIKGLGRPRHRSPPRRTAPVATRGPGGLPAPTGGLHRWARASARAL